MEIIVEFMRRILPKSVPKLSPKPAPRRPRMIGPRAEFGPIKLSGRETEVLKATAEGMSLAQTAAELGIASKTVDNTKARLMRKLGVHKSTDLVLIAVAAELVPLPDLSHLRIQFPPMRKVAE